MNIYLVLDGSDSIGASNFTGAKQCLTNLIEKVDQSFPPFEVRGPYLDLTAFLCPQRLWVQVLLSSSSSSSS